MKDLYLGYAGNFQKGHGIHDAIEHCRPGDEIKLSVRDGHIYLTNNKDIAICRLSKAARDIWIAKVSTVQKIQILAMVRWGKVDMSERGYAEQCKCETWEVPVCEVVSG
jgi:hypothetical protein